METVIGFTAIAVAILIGLGALGVGIGMGLRRPLPRRRRAPAGTRADAADEDVHRRRVARRGGDDRRGYRAVLRLRQPVRRPVAGCDRRGPVDHGRRKATVRTDIPQAELGQLAGLAGSVNTKNIRWSALVPRYGTQQVVGASSCSPISGRSAPRSPAPSRSIRSSRRCAGHGRGGCLRLGPEWLRPAGPGTSVAAYLEYYGLNASAPAQNPPAVPPANRIVVYNGAEEELTSTVEFLETLFETKVVLESDPAARVDIIITTAKSSADLSPRPRPRLCVILGPATGQICLGRLLGRMRETFRPPPGLLSARWRLIVVARARWTALERAQHSRGEYLANWGPGKTARGVRPG